jgi:hypothetical protein
MVRDGNKIRREVHPFPKDKSLDGDLFLNVDHIVCIQKAAFDGELTNIYRQHTAGILLAKPRVQMVRQ